MSYKNKKRAKDDYSMRVNNLQHAKDFGLISKEQYAKGIHIANRIKKNKSVDLLHI